jgi:hypothetical protein
MPVRRAAEAKPLLTSLTGAHAEAMPRSQLARICALRRAANNCRGIRMIGRRFAVGTRPGPVEIDEHTIDLLPG